MAATSNDWFIQNDPTGTGIPAIDVATNVGVPANPTAPSPLPTGGQTDPTASSVTPSAVAFDGSIGSLQAALQAGGWTGEDPNYWYNRILQTGGDTPSNLAYWQSRISAGPSSVQPGGQYYEAPATSGTSTSPLAAPTDASLANFGAPPTTYASTPFTGSFALPQLPAALAAGYQLPTMPSSISGGFQAPTLTDLQNSPGFQEGAALGQQGIQRNAAAQGTVLNGGTQKALQDYYAQYAQQGYGNLYNQDLSTFNANTTGYQNLVGNSLNAFGENLTNYQDQVSNANLTNQNNYTAYLNQNANALSDYMTNYGISHAQSTDWWNQNDFMAQQGLTAATAAKPA
jgi:hypothetical protein